uniref:General transcription factor 3C polypeptide 3 n=1 Tax=Noccaea caerulescens TaxID=107243 RepID=A0A1J3I021_NOCCA
MVAKGKSQVVGDEENLISELEEGLSNMEIGKEDCGGNGRDDNHDDEEGKVDNDSEEGHKFETGSEIPNKFERLEYEALAGSQRDGSEKRGKYDGIRISNSTSGEEGFMELLSSDRRRKSRKHKKRGTSHGSKKEVAPEILKMFREALFLHIHGRDIEALPIIAEVIKQAPAYREALKIAANMQDLCLNARVGVNEQQAP